MLQRAKVYFLTALSMVLLIDPFYRLMSQTEALFRLKSIAGSFGEVYGVWLFYMIVYTFLCLAIGNMAAYAIDSVGNVIAKVWEDWRLVRIARNKKWLAN
jgi:hypothetical protein